MLLQAILACALVATSAAPSFGLLAKVKKAEIKYKLLPHLGFAKYNAVRYEPLRESPAAAPAPAAPYPAEVAAPAAPYPAPSGPYPASL